jgi:hypothetical protein
MDPVGLDCAGFGSFRYQLRSLLKNLDLEDPALEDLFTKIAALQGSALNAQRFWGHDADAAMQ